MPLSVLLFGLAVAFAFYGAFWLFIHFVLNWDEFGNPWFLLCVSVTLIIGLAMYFWAPR